MGKKKANANTPRVKRMKREGRLQSATAKWLKTYTGNRPIYGYRKHFGVSIGTAIAELRILGVPLSDGAVQKAIAGEQAAIRDKQARKEKRRRNLEEKLSSAAVQIRGQMRRTHILLDIRLGDLRTALHGKIWRGSPITRAWIVLFLPGAGILSHFLMMRSYQLLKRWRRKRCLSIWRRS